MPTPSAQDRDETAWDGAMLRAMAEASQDCIWVLSPEGEVRYMNTRAQTLLSHAAETGPALRALWPEESRFGLDRAVAAARGGQVFKFRAFFRGRDQAGAYWETVISPIQARDGGAGAMLAVGREVTAEVETHAFLDTVIQLLPSPLTVKNVADRRFVLINRAAEDLFGLPAEAVLGRCAEEVFGEANGPFAELENKVLRAGGIGEMNYVTAPAESADARQMAIRILATHDDQGARHLISVADDVTERRAAAETLRAALAAAEQASQAKTAFLANMSHEIRTPLNGIIAGADMLARGDLSGRAQDLVSMIRASSETLERLLSDILDLARAESGKIELEARAFHIGETVRSVADLFRLAAEQKGLTLEIELAPELDSAAVGDLARLRQVLSNLLSNAVKFTQTGSIALKAGRTAEGQARFEVRDTGVGFEPAAKAQLFGRFQQADDTFTRAFGGAGLGLAISHQLVALMGGALDGDGPARRRRLLLVRDRPARGRGPTDARRLGGAGLGGARPAHPAGRRPSDQSPGGGLDAGRRGRDHRCRGRRAGGRGLSPRPFRPGADGHADAGDGRADRRTRAAPAGDPGPDRAHADHHADRQRPARTPRRQRCGRRRPAPGQAGHHPGAVRGHRGRARRADPGKSPSLRELRKSRPYWDCIGNPSPP